MLHKIIFLTVTYGLHMDDASSVFDIFIIHYYVIRCCVFCIYCSVIYAEHAARGRAGRVVLCVRPLPRCGRGPFLYRYFPFEYLVQVFCLIVGAVAYVFHDGVALVAC